MPSLVWFLIAKVVMTVKNSRDLSDDVGDVCFLVFLSRDPELYSLLDATVVHFSSF